jgi:CheY-like chemotaxis protein
MADDNPDDRALVIRELRREFPDLEVTEVTNPDKVARALESRAFDLLVTDYHLRWTDGLSVLRAVRARQPRCPAMHRQRGDRGRGHEGGPG